jgi:hypothetical protein
MDLVFALGDRQFGRDFGSTITLYGDNILLRKMDKRK